MKFCRFKDVLNVLYAKKVLVQNNEIIGRCINITVDEINPNKESYTLVCEKASEPGRTSHILITDEFHTKLSSLDKIIKGFETEDLAALYIECK